MNSDQVLLIPFIFPGPQHLTLVSVLHRGRAFAWEPGKWDPSLNFATVWFYGLVQVLEVLWFSDPTAGNDGRGTITIKIPALRLTEHPLGAGAVYTCTQRVHTLHA